MSSPSIPGDRSSTVSPDSGSVSDLYVTLRHSIPRLDRLSSVVGRPVRAIAFWSAIALPFLNLGLLSTGLSTTARTAAFVLLLVANLVALYVGHPYGRDG